MGDKKMQTEDMVRYCTAYLRKSTEEQSHFSLINQRQYCQREAKARGYELPDSYIFEDDGFSAKTINRPGLIKLLTLCKKKKDIVAVITYKIDRLSRDTADYLGLRKVLAENSIKIISCTEPTDDSPAGEFIETILAAAARYDNAIKSERVRDGMLQRIKAGLPNGARKLGYLKQVLPDGTRTVIEDPQTFDILRQAWLEMETGRHSLDSTAKFLNDHEVKTRKGSKTFKLTRQHVSRIFSDKTYCGYAISKKNNLEVKSDKIPQMISEDTFYRVRSILLKRNTLPSLYQKLRPEFPLRGFLLCPVCFESLRAGFSKGRSKYYGYYFCQKHSKPCLSSEFIEEALVELLRSLTPDVLLRKAFLYEVKRKWNNKYHNFTKQQAKIQFDIDGLKQLQTTIAKKNAQGVYPDNFTKEQIEKIDLEIATKKTILSESRLAQVDIEILITFMNSFLEDLGKAYLEEKSLELKRFMIGSIFPKKLVFRNGNLEPLKLSPGFELIRGLITHDVSLSGRKRT